MLNIKRFICNMLQENCYVANDETRECIIIDCGAFYPEERTTIVQYIRDNQLIPKHLLVTHAHFDHNFGNETLFKEFGLKPEVHHNDKPLMDNVAQQAERITGIKPTSEFPSVEKYLNDDDKITFGTHTFTIIATPGHSPGGVFYHCAEEHLAFSGDTLFHYSVGRTDFDGGNMFQLIQSLRVVSQLPDNTIIFPGHGDQTTIGAEVAGNPYLDR